MKKVLITGRGSYIGTALMRYLSYFPGQYEVCELDMHSDAWKDTSFAAYDTVFHVAALVHQRTPQYGREEWQRYVRINRDLAIDCARHAKACGVKQFIFISTAAVYGSGIAIGKPCHITADTPTSPVNFYGKTKLMAEEALTPLQSENFQVAILRPPMVYGPGCPGNYPALVKAAKCLPIFPAVKNERSMLYIDNLCEFVRLLIDRCDHGLFFPQNREYTVTSDMVRRIARAHHRFILCVPGFTWLMKRLARRSPLPNKVFGNFTYDPSLSDYCQDYQLYSLDESIRRTEQSEAPHPE